MIQKILEQRRSACVLRFVHYASSTMESSKLYMWQIWWNVDDIQRLVVLGFAIYALSD